MPENDVLRDLDPRVIGRRLQEARVARGRTQQEAADHLAVARTTITAIEKGERRIQPAELVRLASFYGRAIGELLRRGEPVEPFVVQLRAVLERDPQVETQLDPSTAELQRLSEDYLELERLCDAPLVRKYPPQYRIGGGIDPEASAEDIAVEERQRLGLGDGPIVNLRELLENDVGLRIFYLDLPSKIAAMFAYTEQFGGCIAVNRKHPPERGRMSLSHDYGHFLTNRYRPEVTLLGRYHRQPEHERFADAFASAFLMPSSGLRRRYHELRQSREGGVKVADLIRLAQIYLVSVEALTRRLEELRLVSGGTWERLRQKGLRVREAQAQLGLELPSTSEPMLPLRYRYLAVEALERGELSEGQLARFLRADRLEARRLASELARPTVLSDEGMAEALMLDFGGTVTSRGVD